MRPVRKQIFPKVFSVLRTFHYLNIPEVVERCQPALPFSDRTLRSMMSGKTLTPNINAIEGIANIYNVTPGYMLDGTPSHDICYGLVDETKGGNVAYFILPVLYAFCEYLVSKHPKMGAELVEWDEWADRGWSVDDHQDMHENFRVNAGLDTGASTAHPVRYRGVVVGYSLDDRLVDWFELRLNCCADVCLAQVHKSAHKQIDAPWSGDSPIKAGAA